MLHIASKPKNVRNKNYFAKKPSLSMMMKIFFSQEDERKTKEKNTNTNKHGEK